VDEKGFSTDDFLPRWSLATQERSEATASIATAMVAAFVRLFDPFFVPSAARNTMRKWK
jgi:hypothetical protein